MHAPALAHPRSTPEPARAPCICCGGLAWQPHLRILTQCTACGFIRADMSLGPEEAERLYQEGYFTGAEYGDYLADAESHQRNFAARLQLVRRLSGGTPGPLLEIGCAYGFFLEQCSRHGIEATGVDVCVEPVRHARMVLNVDARIGAFESLPLEAGRWQSVCMWDTIEHLEHPEAFVARARELLAPGGMLFVTTGDIGSAFARWRGPRWRMIHPPTHLQYFSTASLARLLERHGFRVEEARSTAMYRNFGESLGRMATLGRGLPARLAAAARRLTPGFVARRGFWLDLGDIMFVAARKGA
jgi:SAM-dependent methyltransferase